MTKQGDKPRLEKGPNGTAIVRAYTDLKRHNLCDDPGPVRSAGSATSSWLRAGRDQDGKPGTEFFLTRKLWDVGNTAPYGHRGDVSTITEAILYCTVARDVPHVMRLQPPPWTTRRPWSRS